MHRTTIGLLLLIGVMIGASWLIRPAHAVSRIGAETRGESQQDARDAIEGVLERFARARYAGDVDAARACTHPEVVRRMLTGMHWGSPCAPWVRDLAPSSLRFITWQNAEERGLDPETAPVDITVFDTSSITSSALLRTMGGIELVHLVLYDGQWLIADTLRSELPPTEGDPDRGAIEAVCRDYTMGFYEMDGERVQGACHSALSKRTVQNPGPAPNAAPGQPGGFDFVEIITYEEMDRLASSFNAMFGFDPETSRCDIDIYYLDDHIACAKMVGASWFDYFHLVKIDAEWVIVNIVFEALPRDRWQSSE